MARRARPQAGPRLVPLVLPLARRAAATAGLAACAAVAALPLLAGSTLAGTATAATVATARAGQPTGAPLRMTVTRVSPTYAQDGKVLILSGRVRNVSGSAITGLTVRLLSSTAPLASRTYLVDYAHGSYSPPVSAVPLAAPVSTAQLAAGRSWTWTARIPVSALGLRCFGVYPLTAQVADATGTYLASDPVPLPFWPAKPHACASQPRPKPFPVSWIWPLIDVPHQGPCPGLLDNSLARAIAPGGRLRDLLAVGSEYAAKAGLTWAVDPALLDNLTTMTHPYQVSGSATCAPSGQYPASARAAAWLSALRKATAGQPVFVTPYADVDAGALTRFGGPDLGLAFTDGDQIAHQVLGRAATPAALPNAGLHELSAIAWPPGGTASPAVLEKLAALRLGTVILAMPPSSTTVAVTPGAVRRYLTGIGRWRQILLADHGITTLLASPYANSRHRGDIVAVSQLFLAETAQIAAQAPGQVRPIVVAPPRRWDPAANLASRLLNDTVTAPWLSPATAGQLVAMPHQRAGLPAGQPQRGLPGKLLRSVSRLDRQISMLESIRVTPDPRLYRAVFGIESSSWRGRSARQAKVLLDLTSRYVKDQLGGLAIIGSPYVTLGGKVSPVPVVIRNTLGYRVRVRLVVQASDATVTLAKPLITVPPHSYSGAIHLIVHASGSGQGTIRLSLTSPGRTPLPVRLVMRVKPTNFGTIALVVCAAVLAVFVIASAARALRHGRPDPARAAGPTNSRPTDSGPTNSRPTDSGLTDSGSAVSGPGGTSADPFDQRGYPGSVVSGGPELTSAGHVAADQEPIGPGRSPSEERR